MSGATGDLGTSFAVQPLNPVPGFVDRGHIVCPVCTDWWARGCAGYLNPISKCWRIPSQIAQVEP